VRGQSPLPSDKAYASVACWMHFQPHSLYLSPAVLIRELPPLVGCLRLHAYMQRCQDTSDPRHSGISAELLGHICTSAEVSCAHFGTKEDNLAPGNTRPSHGKADFCACVITRIRLTGYYTPCPEKRCHLIICRNFAES